MTDSMNFGPEWLRNMPSEGLTTANSGGGTGGGSRYQLADYRYGREEMLALFEKGIKAPQSLTLFASLYSEQVLPPLALLPQGDEERGWQSRSVPPSSVIRGRGGSLERGGRGGRGRGSYQSYGRGYEGSGASWSGVGVEPSEWSPRKDFIRGSSVDNWRKTRGGEDDDGWRSGVHSRPPMEKWGRSTSWRDGGDGMEDRGAPERNNRTSWQEGMRGGSHRRAWDGEDHLPEWAMENPSEAGGTFDSTGAFHGSDEEQREHRNLQKKDVSLQKSVSQQAITTKTHPAPLISSQSALSLSKSVDEDTRLSESAHKDEPKQLDTKKEIEATKKVEHIKSTKVKENIKEVKREHKEQSSDKQNDVNHTVNNLNLNGTEDSDMNNKADEEFQRIQEDLVKKLVVDEETPRKINMENFSISQNVNPTLPPPNLVQPLQHDKWYYQDPQGELQGPFLSSEMGEWFRAGYFTTSLLVKRVCDDSFYRLGELVSLCSGNPFQTNIRIPPLKPEMTNVEPEMIQLQILQRQLALKRQQSASMRALNHQPEPWNNIPNMQQRELIAQQVITHPQFLQQQPVPQTNNPLMQMLSQMQQAKQLTTTNLPDKNPTALSQQLDPIQALVQQMGIQNQTSIPGLSTTTASNSAVLSSSLKSNTNLMNNYQNLSGNVPIVMPNAGGLLVSGNLNSSGGLPVTGIPNLSNSGLLPGNETLNGTGLPVSATLTNAGLPVNLQTGLPNSLASTLPPRPNPVGAVDPLVSNDNEALKNLLLQLANKHQQNPQLDSLWQQSQFNNSSPSKPQWQPNSSEVPISMWEFQSSAVATTVPNPVPSDKAIINPEQAKIHEKERQKKIKENQEKEILKKKMEEKLQAKREAEEKRKEEQRRQEAERRAVEEKKKKEDDKIKRELDKAKKEAEDKRLRELEEKRRLKEQRKAEEEMRKKIEEQRKLEEERLRREAKEREEQLLRQAEAAAREELHLKVPKIAPWSQANCTAELSLAEIQKAEQREKRAAEQAALLQQHRNQQILQEQQQQVISEKQTLQLNWAKKPPETRKVKSFAEIQQEEQERLAKQSAEARLAQSKEKEIINSAPIQTSPWSGQNLSWASAANSAPQWNNNNGGFWEEMSTQKVLHKPTPVTKSNSASAVSKPLAKPNKSKTKKEEQQVLKIFNNGPSTDDFTNWCTATLSKITNNIDIPTFISFLRDIESALEIRDYCREYLGDVTSAQQFASLFLEKRRLMKPKVVAQKDDMCSPAPAITPCSQPHSTECQDVKGKGKKTKKSKMIKVDARNLGFSVTAATDRINVGDRDYVEN